MPSNNKHFDIILVLQNYRHCELFLCIIDALAIDFKIGIIRANRNSKMKRTKDAQMSFEDMCFQSGAKEVTGVSKTKLLISPSRVGDVDFSHILKTIKYSRIVCLASLEEPFIRIKKMKENNIRDLFILDRSRMLMGRSTEELNFINENFKLHVIGVPYSKYPAKKISTPIDYLIAIPTHVALPSIHDRLSLTKNILNLVSKIDTNNLIAIKKHPVRDNGNPLYKVSAVTHIQKLPKLIRYFLSKLLEIAIKTKLILPTKVYIKLVLNYTHVLNAQLADRAKNLNEFTEHPFLGLEFFLKHIRKGVITGNSGSLFHSLSQRVPVYNCSPAPSDNVDARIKRNYEWVGRRTSCKNSLVFDNSLFSVLDAEVYDADIMSTIKRLLSA